MMNQIEVGDICRKANEHIPLRIMAIKTYNGRQVTQYQVLRSRRLSAEWWPLPLFILLSKGPNHDRD